MLRVDYRVQGIKPGQLEVKHITHYAVSLAPCKTSLLGWHQILEFTCGGKVDLHALPKDIKPYPAEPAFEYDICPPPQMLNQNSSLSWQGESSGV